MELNQSDCHLPKEDSKTLIDTYTGLVFEFGKNHQDPCWYGTFLSTKDRFHSPFFQTFLKIYNKNILVSPYLSLFSFLYLLVFKFSKWTLYLLRSFFLILYTQIIWRKKKETFRSLPFKNIHLLKSFTFGSVSTDKPFHDPFFSSLATYIRGKGISTFTIVDPLNNPAQSIKDLLNQELVFPFHIFNSPFDIIVIFFEVIFSFFNPPQGSPQYNKFSLRKIMLRQFRTDLFNPILLQGLLINKSLKRFSKLNKIEKVFMTYENLNWERPFIQAIREASPQTKIIGFQHAVVPESCTNYFLAPKEELSVPLPDLIITNGEATKRILKSYGNYEKTPIAAGAALRQPYLSKAKKPSRSYDKKLLIALEGNFQTAKCANYVFKFIQELKDWEITIRTHPIMPIERLSPFLNLKLSEHCNIEVSSGRSLSKDLGNSSVIIYWGTTVSLEALAMGKSVIHFDRGDDLSYDPVFELEGLKRTACETDSLPKILHDIMNMPESEYQKKSLETQEYIANYFYPINDENLDTFLS